MATPVISLSPAAATELARAALGRPLTVTALRPLHGGMVNAVQEWATDGQPPLIVAKLCPDPADVFRHEFETLRWYRARTRFPVPEPYGCLAGAGGFPGSCLLMQRLPGRNLAEAGLTEAGRRHFEEELAGFVADLHEHRRGAYGSALGGEALPRWLDWFAPKIQHNFERSAARLSPSARGVTEKLLADLGAWLPECARPTLVHGDLWATNILVDDADADRPRITGFVDGGANYADPEYELAYLRVFRTAGREFLRAYATRHPLREGFERRCRVYWLNTMLLHLWFFGDEYAPSCERLAAEVARLA